MKEVRRNWAGNYKYLANQFESPFSWDAVQELVRKNSKVKALGTRHSFNSIADSAGIQISLEQIHDQIFIDNGNRLVKLPGGMNYGVLSVELEKSGFALPNLASLPHISVAGAIMTGTHGTGDERQSLAGSILELEMITSEGEIVTFKKGEVEFDGAVASMGSLGIVKSLTLGLVPTYEVSQTVYLGLDFEVAMDNLDHIFSSSTSVSLFTSWKGDRIDQVWRKQNLSDSREFHFGKEFFGAIRAERKMHPILDTDPINCTDQMGIPGSWYDRLPHFRMGFTPSKGEEIQSEYLVPRSMAKEALQALHCIQDQFNDLLLISELRTIAQDSYWMSPFYDSDRLGIHFTWKPDQSKVVETLPLIESCLAEFDVRPHWGKLFVMDGADFSSLYPKFDEFKKLVSKHDEYGKFTNDFLKKVLGLS